MNHGRWGRKWRALVRTKGSKVVEGEWVVGHLGTPMGFLNAQDTLLGRIASDHLLALPAWVRCLCWPPWAHMVPFSLLAVPCSCSLQAVAAAAQAGLLRQQEELDRKAAELERKERELQNTAANLHVRENNWPPLPSWCPVKPCFYQDFSTEIPADYQRICKMLYYLWMLHSVTLFLNLLACLAWFTSDAANGTAFGLSILWFLIFTPCAFLCWYRPIYKAFRSDNSFSFFVFFFVFFCQIGIYFIQLIGLPNLGTSGWLAALSTVNKGPLAVTIIMMVVAGFFTLCAGLSLFLLQRVHAFYRRTGASFQQAQEEFSQGIFSSRTFRTAASSAARGTFQGN